MNSFNADFLTAFSLAYHLESQVICIVANATLEAIEEASKAHVRLVPLPYTPEATSFDSSHGQAGIDALESLSVSYDPVKTVWLGHDRITGAAAIAAAKISGGRSAVIHHMSYDHYESYAEGSQTTYSKVQTQTTVFREADIVLAVGPLLRDAAIDLVRGPKTVHMLIPGLAEINPQNAPNTFVAFMGGRLTEDASRIKQGHLGIAAVAQAQRDARDEGRPEALRRPPKLLLRGVDFEGALANSPLPDQRSPEAELKRFAEKYADGVVNLHALPYTENRQTLYDDLSGASVALMPSWHEGFGLVGWEAIAAGVPLIVSENSGLYRLLEENHPGQGTGCVYSLVIRGKEDEPFFHDGDLAAAVEVLKQIADNPAKARKQASTLKTILEDYTWAACARQASDAFGWILKKGSMPAITPESLLQTPSNIVVPSIAPEGAYGPLQLLTKQWRPGAGMAESQLLRAEEGLLPFDPARQPDIDDLNTWLDDIQWPLTVRLITGAGGQGKTRLALELCEQRLKAGWHAGFLASDLEADRMSASWQKLHDINRPLLIVIDYVETRQTAFLSLLKAYLQNPGEKTVRVLLLARDAGEWWDNLPSKDRRCEPLLSGPATSGPFRLPALYAAEPDRRNAYNKALQAFAQIFGVRSPNIVPDLQGEHFERPLYVQMAALLALYGERPTTAQGLTKALLNHERRYWLGILAPFNWLEPERRAEQLLALATLAGGFATYRAAEPYWKEAKGTVLNLADFSSLFRALAILYPGVQGLQALRPDLLGEALVAQSLLRPGAETLLDAVLSSTATRTIRRNALTVLARLSPQRPDLHEMLVEAFVRHFRNCCQDIAAVGTETTSRLPALAEEAFTRLSLADKSQTAGLLAPLLQEESLQLAGLICMVSEYLVEKTQSNFKKKPSNIERMAAYAYALDTYGINLARIGRYQQGSDAGHSSLTLYGQLLVKDPSRFASNYAAALINYSNHMSNVGQDDKALEYSGKALELYQRLAQKNPETYEYNYAASMYTYAINLSDAERDDEALEYSRQALELYQRLVQKNPDIYNHLYASALSNYAGRLSVVDRDDEALEYARQALDIRQELVHRKPDRFEPDYVSSLANYGDHLSYVGRYKESLEHGRQALDIHRRLAQKHPDRFDSGYARALARYGNRLGHVGRYEEALEHTRQSLDIWRELADRNADKFKPDYAKALHSYANRLSDVGRYEEALEHTRQSLDIWQELLHRNSTSSAEYLSISICSVDFQTWIYAPDKREYQLDIDQLMPSIRSHRRFFVLFLSAFVEACWSTDRASRISSFQRLYIAWNDLPMASKLIVEGFKLCADAWFAGIGQADIIENNWELGFQKFMNQRSGRLPQWMLQVAQRLGFQWPNKP